MPKSSDVTTRYSCDSIRARARKFDLLLAKVKTHGYEEHERNKAGSTLLVV